MPKVTFTRSGKTIDWDASCDSILELGEKSGLVLDSSCRSGICHTCMVPLTKGEVDYEMEPEMAPDPGCALICCSTPKTDVEIDA